MNRLRWMLAATPALLFCVSQATAQVELKTDALRGAVLDPGGASVPGAEVVIFRQGTTIAHVTTNEQGEFTFTAAPLEYQVTVRARGFSELRSGLVPFKEGSLSYFRLRPEAQENLGPVVPPEPTLLTRRSASEGALQESPVHREAVSAPWELGVLAQSGVGTSDRSDFKFLLLGAHAGKVLTPNLGSGVFQGNFEYAVEVFPLWQSYTPRFQKVSCTPLTGTAELYHCSAPYTVGGTYTGVSITPIMLRWNLTHGERWMPWLQGAGGVVWTNHKYPAIGNTNPADLASNGPNGDASVWNFTPQFGIGTHYFLKPRRSLDISANAVHISSASLGDKNPGVNASIQFSVGYTWWK